jgi:hypothetical protein
MSGGGRESNPPKAFRPSTGFEDREGHQSPFASREHGSRRPGAQSPSESSVAARKAGVPTRPPSSGEIVVALESKQQPLALQAPSIASQ